MAQDLLLHVSVNLVLVMHSNFCSVFLHFSLNLFLILHLCNFSYNFSHKDEMW